MAWVQFTRTPVRISPEIIRLCRDLVADARQAFFLAAQPIPGADPLQCFPVVEEFVAKNGGELCVGWRIWEWPEVMIEAEFHGVWQAPNGDLRDLTTEAATGRILFLRDPAKKYEGKRVKAVRRPLADIQEIRDLFQAEDDIFEFLDRPEFALPGSVELTGRDREEWLEIQTRKNRAISALPCFCRSGNKVNDCHPLSGP